ncbi:MAG: deca-heme C-type cytochrome-like protein [Dehalococcoidales bacterium]|nr:deca-heme C-type cytochrome-like protein [Dehalococcoidales bacterium]
MTEPSPLDKEATSNEGLPAYFIRFNYGQRIEHVLLMVSFTVLSVTGLAQRFSTAGWAEWLILSLGGIESSRLIHRVFGLIFILSAIYHFSYLAYALLIRHVRPTMVPTLKDVRDVIDVLRYTFGFTDRPPQFGHFDYRQKFEYWGLMFGSVVIVTTGFILAYPIAVARVLPGEAIAAAKEFHGYEATLAVLTIVLWHLYDVILKPAIFPADTSIFTGKISRKRMLEEHSLEYARLIGEQDLKEVAAAAKPSLDSTSD